MKANRLLCEALRERLDDAASEVLNTHGQAQGCRPLAWSVPEHDGWIYSGLSGLASCGYYADADALVVISQWVSAFGLRPVQRPAPGTRSYQGEIEGVRVEVWAITDRDEFEHPVQTASSREQPDSAPEGSR